jgi:hypothetical protein
MNWLYEKKMKEGGGGGGGSMQASGAGSMNEPAAFSMIENVSFAKGFSYSGVDTDTMSQGDGGLTMPGAFSFLNGAASGGERMQQDLDRGGAGGGSGGGPKRSKKEELFNMQMEQYKRERESGMPKGPNRM